jgi:hypothetical protein
LPLSPGAYDVRKGNVVERSAEEDRHTVRMADLKPGWIVVGNDGQRIGEVRDVGQDYILTSTTGLASDVYVPATAVANVEHEVIHLSVPRRDVANMGWEQPPRTDDAPATPDDTDRHRHI